jgi:hypothetical protein
MLTYFRKEKPAYIQELIDDALVKVPKLSMKKEASTVQTIFFQRFCTNK